MQGSAVAARRASFPECVELFGGIQIEALQRSSTSLAACLIAQSVAGVRFVGYILRRNELTPALLFGLAA
jgi:hypothetical protein